MPQHPCYHAWDAGNAFEEHNADQPLSLVHRAEVAIPVLFLVFGGGRVGVVVAVAGAEVHAPAEDSNHCKGNFIRPGFGFPVGDYDAIHLLFGVAVDIVSQDRIVKTKEQ